MNPTHEKALYRKACALQASGCWKQAHLLLQEINSNSIKDTEAEVKTVLDNFWSFMKEFSQRVVLSGRLPADCKVCSCTHRIAWHC